VVSQDEPCTGQDDTVGVCVRARVRCYRDRMNRFLSFAIIGISLASAHTFAQAPQSTCPPAVGAYYRSAGVWEAMDATRSVGFKSTGVMKAAFSYGAASMKYKAQFRDARSPYQLTDEPFEMCLVGVTDNGRDVTLVKLQQEKDRRELEVASLRTWSGINAQIDPKVVVPTQVSKVGEKVYLITSKKPVPEGEFILFTIVPDIASMVKANTPASLGGYDLGNHERR
jgi:hypothetical protein